MSDFEGKVALITGSSAGIGACAAVFLAKRGCCISLTGRNEENLKKVQAECIAAGLTAQQVIYTVGEITSDEVQLKLVEDTVTKLGGINILVNNAGTPTMEGEKGCSINSSLEVYDYIMNVNTRSVVSLTKLCLPHLEKTKGVIINVSSCASFMSFPPFLYYAMSKAALDHFTRCLAAELGPKGIRANCINPAYVKTSIIRRSGLPEAAIEKIEEGMLPQYPLGRLGESEDIANLIVFLADDKSSFITGQTHVICGGGSVNYRTD